MNQIEFILFVRDQKLSKDFYSKVLGMSPSLDVAGMTEFDIGEYCKLGLLAEVNAASILKTEYLPLSDNRRIPRCELYLKVSDPAAYLERALQAGGREISKPQPRDWGDIVAYCADPDGHIVAFAE
jgi:predicted enzyme related to lactoylglutathione lyase